MPRRDIREYIRSRWDARFLVNNIMGLISKQVDPSGDVVLAIITASIRSYSKAYSGRMDRTHEEGTYEALKGYAHERVVHKGRDAEYMEEFLSMVRWAESEVFGFISVTECDTKPNASFPMDCLGEEELAIVKNGAWERFRASIAKASAKLPAESLSRSYPRAAGFFFGNTELGRWSMLLGAGLTTKSLPAT